MSGVSQAVPDKGQRSRPPRRFLGFEVTLDWLLRPLFGFGLAAIAVAATWYGGFWFALFISAGASAAAREWHRMLSGTSYLWLTVISICAIVASSGSEVAVSGMSSPDVQVVPWLVLAVGALLNLILSPVGRTARLWHAASMLYIGVPALCLVTIRQTAASGVAELFAIFFAVWLTDTGALFTGNLLKGPKLWPALSPNKTWAGFIGGTVFGMVAAAIVFLIARANPWHGALLGLCAALIGHAGDLFESFVKRRVGRKNSGSLIPGHGGVLDRIDSMLFVAPVAALVFLALHVDPFTAVAS